MMLNCDLTSALEDGSIGGVVIAIVWALWAWYQRHHLSPKKSAYEK
jgi:hypothetical protein